MEDKKKQVDVVASSQQEAGGKELQLTKTGKPTIDSLINETLDSIKEDLSRIKRAVKTDDLKSKPVFDPDEGVFKYVLSELAFSIRWLFERRWWRFFAWLVLAAFVIYACLQGGRMYSDNCRKQAQISSLENMESRYRMLRRWAEHDKEWRMKFLLVDRYYSDIDFYREDIDALNNYILGLDSIKQN